MEEHVLSYVKQNQDPGLFTIYFQQNNPTRRDISCYDTDPQVIYKNGALSSSYEKESDYLKEDEEEEKHKRQEKMKYFLSGCVGRQRIKAQQFHALANTNLIQRDLGIKQKQKETNILRVIQGQNGSKESSQKKTHNNKDMEQAMLEKVKQKQYDKCLINSSSLESRKNEPQTKQNIKRPQKTDKKGMNKKANKMYGTIKYFQLFQNCGTSNQGLVSVEENQRIIKGLGKELQNEIHGIGEQNSNKKMNMNMSMQVSQISQNLCEAVKKENENIQNKQNETHGRSNSSLVNGKSNEVKKEDKAKNTKKQLKKVQSRLLDEQMFSGNRNKLLNLPEIYYSNNSIKSLITPNIQNSRSIYLEGVHSKIYTENEKRNNRLLQMFRAKDKNYSSRPKDQNYSCFAPKKEEAAQAYFSKCCSIEKKKSTAKINIGEHANNQFMQSWTQRKKQLLLKIRQSEIGNQSKHNQQEKLLSNLDQLPKLKIYLNVKQESNHKRMTSI